MGARKIYIEAGVTEDGQVILEEITGDVMMLANMLKDIIPDMTPEFMRACNKEGDLMASRIMLPFPDFAHAAKKVSFHTGDDNFTLEDWEVESELEIIDGENDDEEVVEDDDTGGGLQ